MTTPDSTTGFVAVVPAEALAHRPALLAAGASDVLSWADLATSTASDDAPAVLFDVPDLPDLLAAPGSPDRLTAVLRRLTSVDSLDGSARGSLDGSPDGPAPGLAGSAGSAPPADHDVVIATVRPVIDTLKLVDAAGLLTGTADRNEHRFVGTPIAARLRVLRAVGRELADTAGEQIDPEPVAVLSALVGRGATVLGSG